MHQLMLLNPSAITSPARWHLRLVVLLLAITFLHVWAGPGLSNSTGVPTESAAMSTVTQQASVAPAVLVPVDVSYQTSTPLIGPASAQNADPGDVCATACPDGHMVTTALCSMVLIVAGLIGLYCRRSMIFLAGNNGTREPRPSIAAPPHSNGVCLLQLSISRI